MVKVLDGKLNLKCFQYYHILLMKMAMHLQILVV